MSKTNKKSSSSSVWLYSLLLIFFAYLYIQILGFTAEDSNNMILSGLYFVEFGVHEASHIVVGFLPPILVAGAGSIGEVVFTLLLLLASLKAKSYFAAIFASLWVMLAMNSAGRYMADARAQQLPLIGPGETIKHDWNFVFGQLGWLNADTLIGGILRGVGDVIGAVAILAGLYLVISMMTKRPKSALDDAR